MRAEKLHSASFLCVLLSFYNCMYYLSSSCYYVLITNINLVQQDREGHLHIILHSQWQVLRMKKRITYRKLGLSTEHRMAMLRNMVTSLIYHERIMTTTPRAKELRRVAEKMIQHAKIGTMHHRRIAGGFVQTLPALTKLFEILGPRYMNRPGGYTRIMKLALPRRGDSADMSYIEFVDRQGELRTARPAKQPFKRTFH